jgi:hypothetical protein
MSATNIPSACRIANIASNDAMILSYDANLGRMEFSEGTGQFYTDFYRARAYAELSAQSGRAFNPTF